LYSFANRFHVTIGNIKDLLYVGDAGAGRGLNKMAGDSHSGEDAKYCFDLARRYDRDRYICASLAPGDRRDDLLALLAFNLEIAGTRESVSEPIIGQMRLKWWFDALDGICSGNPPSHPVAVPLSHAVSNAALQRQELENLIEGRLIDLDGSATETLIELEDYADRTSGALSRLWMAVLGVDGEAAMGVTHHVGVAYALIGLVRAIPLNLARRQLFLPLEVCREAGLDVDTAPDLKLNDGAPPAMISAIEQVLNLAEKHLDDALVLRRDIPRRGISALLPGVLARQYLKELKRCGNDPFKLPVRPPGPTISGMLGLAWATAKGRL
jgi:NADH dehydrogenase [ubiquinone] 1 alpha subcomplex assembly factor 6